MSWHSTLRRVSADYVLFRELTMYAKLSQTNASTKQARARGTNKLRLPEKQVAYALKNIGDRALLSRTALAKLTYIKRMASEDRYRSHLLPRGLALHDVLLACIEKISKEVGNEPRLQRPCSYLQMLAEGVSCQEISKQLGLSREHVTRVYRKKAIELVTEEFLSTVNNGR